MCVLSDIVILIVGILSYAMFRIIAVASMSLIHMLRTPGSIILAILRNMMQRVTIILEYVIGYITDLMITSALGCVSLIQDAFSALVGFLGSVFYEFLVHLHTTLHAFTELLSAILWNIIEGLSLLTISNNFVDLVASFIKQL